MKFLCKLGWHSWGSIKAEEIKITGPDVLFFSWGTQSGTRTCCHCGKEQKLCRSGFVGNGCPNPKWEKVKS
jgi:hypothetical protein